MPTRVYVHTSRGGLHVLEHWLHDWGLYLVHEAAAAESAAAADPAAAHAACGLWGARFLSSDPTPSTARRAKPLSADNPSIT